MPKSTITIIAIIFLVSIISALAFSPLVPREEKHEEKSSTQLAYKFLEKGSLNLKNNDLEKAMKSFEAAIEYDSDKGGINNDVCWRLDQFEYYEEALPYCRKAINLQPNEAYVNDSIAYTLVGLGRAEEAINHYKRAIAIEPKAKYYFRLAEAYIMLDEKEKAIENFEKAKELDEELTEKVDMAVKILSASKK